MLGFELVFQSKGRFYRNDEYGDEDKDEYTNSHHA